ncbi:hypothetical protein GHK86_02610 [Acidimicrobiaceae bacterium USS-CC1]|uniref:SF3 helicase domain-containing protein n=1 Tax=Acidiferrimicrobium australe TaxID=2664430 RepID=A0ABW9QPH8_9ACTN|nr:hypothetical protein [Acidiferrimicrobium australe]
MSATDEWDDLVAEIDGIRPAAQLHEPSSHYEMSELGNARRLVDTFGADLRYVPQWGRWLAWDGSRWAVDSTGQVERCAKATAEAILDEARAVGDDKRFRHGLRAQSASGVRNTVALAGTEPGVPVLVDELDADPMLLGVANGTVDLRTGKLRPSERSDLLTKASRVAYDMDAGCPGFEAFLADILPDPEVRAFLQRFAGYSLTGDVSEHALLVCYGVGANGKSTLLRLLLRLLGEHSIPAPPRLLIADRHPEHPTSVASLHGRRLAVVMEVDEGARWDEATVKNLTGGDRLTARYMRQDFWDFAPTHKFIVATNHKPTVRGGDLGIWRRINLVPFEVTVPPERQDPHLAERLEAELPGILNWALRGCLIWQRDGLGVPAAIREATEAYRAEQDVLAQFLGEVTVTTPVGKVNGGQLYRAYTSWCATQGLDHPLSQKAFVSRLQDRGLRSETDRSKARWWLGIALPIQEAPRGADL